MSFYKLDFHVKSCIQKEGSFHKEIWLKLGGGGYLTATLGA